MLSIEMQILLFSMENHLMAAQTEKHFFKNKFPIVLFIRRVLYVILHKLIAKK